MKKNGTWGNGVDNKKLYYFVVLCLICAALIVTYIGYDWKKQNDEMVKVTTTTTIPEHTELDDGSVFYFYEQNETPDPYISIRPSTDDRFSICVYTEDGRDVCAKFDSEEEGYNWMYDIMSDALLSSSTEDNDMHIIVEDLPDEQYIRLSSGTDNAEVEFIPASSTIAP